jgi:ribosome-associated protein
LKANKLRDFAVKAIEDLKGQDVVCLDIAKLSTIADYMIVVTGTSTRHVKSIADEVATRAKDKGFAVRGMEGTTQAEWILLDLGDVIVHVMQGPVRKLYDLESLWSMTPAKSK